MKESDAPVYSDLDDHFVEVAPNFYAIVVRASTDYNEEMVTAAVKAIPTPSFKGEEYGEARRTAQRLSSEHPGIVFAVDAVYGEWESDTGAFAEEETKEVDRYLNGQEIEVGR